MAFLERFFKRNKPETKQTELIKEKLNLSFSEIKEEGNQIYFTISGETNKIQINEIESVFNEITQNLDIPPLIRQGFGIETSAEGILKVVFHTENYQNIEGFVDEAKRLLNELKTNLESKWT